MTINSTAAEAKNSNLTANTVEPMNTTTPKLVYIGRKRIPYEVKDNEVYDDKTGHILREVDGDPVEMKLCSQCQQWHPINDFYKNKSGNDGLTSSCRFCISGKPSNGGIEKPNNVDSSTVKSSTVHIDNSVQPFLDWLSSHDKEMSDELQSQAETISEQEEQISTLEATIKGQDDTIKKQKREIDKLEAVLNEPLTDDMIMDFLTDDLVTPRMLFLALKVKDTNHIYMYKDKITGQIHPVATT